MTGADWADSWHSPSDATLRRLHTSLPATRAARTPQFRAAFPHRELTIIPVLADDTVSYVLDRLAEADGYAVLVAASNGVMRIVALKEHPDIGGVA